MSALPELRACTDPLLDPGTAAGEADALLRRLEALLERLTPFRRHDATATGETWLDSGLAISPTQAALCLRDVRRTHAFASGLYATILESRDAQPRRATHVLYAGCGPYALLALPSLAAFDPEEARFTLLDIHGECLESAGTLLESLGLADRVSAFVCADAVTTTVADDDPPDVVLTETMTTCLEREPQVAIVRNLLAQAPDAVVLPRSVRVDVVLANPAREFGTSSGGEPADGGPEDDRMPLGTAFELSRETVEAWAEVEDGLLPGGRIHFPSAIEPRHTPLLFTVIDLADGIRMADSDSSLTLPRVVPGDPGRLAGAVVDFRYSLASPPGLVSEART